VRNEEVLYRDKEERNSIQTVKRRKDKWIGQILCGNWLLRQVIGGIIGGRIKVTGRRGRICKQLLDSSKKKRKSWKLKEEALDGTLWRSRFWRNC